MARPKKSAVVQTSGYTIEKAATEGWLVRKDGTPIAVVPTEEQARQYLDMVGK